MLRRWKDDSLKNVVPCIALLLRHSKNRCESLKLTVPHDDDVWMFLYIWRRDALIMVDN